MCTIGTLCKGLIAIKMKILIIEDDKTIAKQIAESLTGSGFVVHTEHDGEEGHFQGESGEFDAIVLDIGLPNMDGFTILEKWRKDDITTPVIILTARNSKMEVVRGLEAGADDYITKPFDADELIARLRSNIRRADGRTSDILKYQDVTLDTKSGKLTIAGNHVKLTRTEFLMVQYLFVNQGRPVSISELAEHVYEDFDSDSGIIPRHIANIRKKIDRELILTETNRGYYIPDDPADSQEG